MLLFSIAPYYLFSTCLHPELCDVAHFAPSVHCCLFFREKCGCGLKGGIFSDFFYVLRAVTIFWRQLHLFSLYFSTKLLFITLESVLIITKTIQGNTYTQFCVLHTYFLNLQLSILEKIYTHKKIF